MDSDKIDIAGIEVKMLEQQIEEQKQMLKHLNKRVQDHMKEKNVLVDANEELEKIIIEREQEINMVRNELTIKIDRLQLFEEEFEIEYEDIIKIRDRAEMFKDETNKYRNKLIEVEKILKNMEKKKEISDELIKNLQTEKVAIEKKLEVEIKEKQESNSVEKLINEIEEIQKLNKEKETILERFQNQNDSLNEKLLKLESENEKYKEELEERETEKGDSKSLSEELGISDSCSYNVGDCEFKDDLTKFPKESKSEAISKRSSKLKIQEMELERVVNSQRFRLASDLLHLKEKEASEGKRCACKRFCRIVHQKYTWKKSFSQEIINKFRALKTEYSCNSCDKTFENVDSLKLHVVTDHVVDSAREKTFLGGRDNGGVIVHNPCFTSGGRLIDP